MPPEKNQLQCRLLLSLLSPPSTEDQLSPPLPKSYSSWQFLSLTPPPFPELLLCSGQTLPPQKHRSCTSAPLPLYIFRFSASSFFLNYTLKLYGLAFIWNLCVDG